MRMRTRLTAGAILAATVVGLGVAPDVAAVADEAPTPRAASRVFSFAGYNGNSPFSTETFTAPGTTPIVGEFSGNSYPDILWYTAGAGGDELWKGIGNFDFDESAVSISGAYTPYVGTFSSPDAKSDILWYSATGASQLWDYNDDGSLTKRSLPAVTGPGQILIGDFAGDGIDDVIRYRPGSASDSWWDFQTVSVAGRFINVNGTFRPIVGPFAGDVIDDILWYAPGATGDPLWDMNGGGAKVQWDLTINGTYTPVVGYYSHDLAHDILWYAPGPAADSYWDFETGTYETETVTVNGTFQPVACDCLQAASPFEDIFWFGPGGAGDVTWKVLTHPLTYTSVGASAAGSSVVATARFTGTNQDILLIRH